MDVLIASHLALLCGYQARSSINQQMGSLEDGGRGRGGGRASRLQTVQVEATRMPSVSMVLLPSEVDTV